MDAGTKRPKVDEGLLWFGDETTGVRLVVSHRFPGRQLARVATSFDLALLAAADGTRSVDDLASTLGVPQRQVLDALEGWEAKAPGTFLWIASSQDEARRDRLRAAAADLHDEAVATRTRARGDNATYHESVIRDAWTQFDEVETTVSHMYRLPHTALGGRTYGEAFCDRLIAMGAFERPGELRVLEIGGGIGLFAKALLDRLAAVSPQVYGRLRYQVLDLSPALQSSQRGVCERHTHLLELTLGNVEHDEPVGAAQGFDVVIANEMIADLSVDVADRERLTRGEADNDGERLMLAHALDFSRVPPTFVVNTGALRLCERLARWLRPGGLAVLTEYGTASQPPRAVDLPGHREHSIRFDHLVTAATKIGLATELHVLGDFLGISSAHATIGDGTARLLFEQLLPLLGVPPPPLVAHDVESLRAALGPTFDRIGNIRFHALDRPGAMLNPHRFMAMTLRAPGEEPPRV